MKCRKTTSTRRIQVLLLLQSDIDQCFPHLTHLPKACVIGVPNGSAVLPDEREGWGFADGGGSSSWYSTQSSSVSTAKPSSFSKNKPPSSSSTACSYSSIFCSMQISLMKSTPSQYEQPWQCLSQAKSVPDDYWATLDDEQNCLRTTFVIAPMTGIGSPFAITSARSLASPDCCRSETLLDRPKKLLYDDTLLSDEDVETAAAKGSLSDSNWAREEMDSGSLYGWCFLFFLGDTRRFISASKAPSTCTPWSQLSLKRDASNSEFSNFDILSSSVDIASTSRLIWIRWQSWSR